MNNYFNLGYYIISLTYDAIESIVKIIVTDNPESLKPETSITLNKVKSFNVTRYHEIDEISLGNFESYELIEQNGINIYKIDTGDALIEIKSYETFKIQS